MLNTLASVNFSLGRLDEAQRQLEEALSIARGAGDREPALLADVLSHLGLSLYSLRRLDDARELLGEALSMREA